MKRAFASIAGLLGLAALGRWLAKRRHQDESVTHPLEPTTIDATAVDSVAVDAAADPAEELRRKLADARETEPESSPTPEQPEETLDERRARVHAKAREAIDSMGTDAPGDGGTSS